MQATLCRYAQPVSDVLQYPRLSMRPPLLNSAAQRGAFRLRLLRWYQLNHRSLPWRENPEPYRVWVSEIMLQQTRVGAVLEHYDRFLRRFPTIESLARARAATVLATWSGLGYYRRARSLQAAAILVVKNYGGNLPESMDALLALPGFGRYTAAAVASIAFGHPHAVLDGNVERVLRRVTGDANASRPFLWTLAEELLSRRHPGDFNQAMMELGAMVCLPSSPRCGACPIQRWCHAQGTSPAPVPRKRRQEKLRLTLAQRAGEVYLVQRPPTASLMPDMWELPETDASHNSGETPVLSLRHAILNTTYHVEVIPAKRADEAAWNRSGGRWVANNRIASLPLTGLSRKILRRIGIISYRSKQESKECQL